MSWLDSLMSALGSAGSNALEQADAVANNAMMFGQGMVDETIDPLNTNTHTFDTPTYDSMNNTHYPKGFEEEILKNFGNTLVAPSRAIDRASKYYTGQGFFTDNPDSNYHGNANSGQATQADGPSDPVGELAKLKATTEQELLQNGKDPIQVLHELNMSQHNAHVHSQDRAQEAETMARLGALQDMSRPDTLSFAASGDRVRQGGLPQPQSEPEHQMFNSQTGTVDSYKPIMGGSFSHSQRPVVEQEQIRILGQLGIPQQGAEALVDNNSQQSAQQVLSQLTQKQLVSKQDETANVIKSYQDAVAKAANPQPVQAALVMQLRNLGYSDPAIKLLLMSLGGQNNNQ